MKTKRLTVVIASLLVASLGATAYAQDAQQSTPQQMPPQTASSTYTKTTTMESSHAMSKDKMSSDKVTKKVKRELKQHGISTNNITVMFADGTATLSGTVASQNDVSKAKSAAMRVKGVKHVDTSDLKVQAQAGQDQGEG